jgi:hypothetical protein
MPHWRLHIFYKESVICFISTSHRFSFKFAFEDFLSFFSRGGGDFPATCIFLLFHHLCRGALFIAFLILT